MRELEAVENYAGTVAFATEDEGVQNGAGINARMYSPGDTLQWCKNRKEDVEDLLVDSSEKIDLRRTIDGDFEFSPRAELLASENSKVAKEFRDRGAIPLTDMARDQLCRMMGRGSFKRGYSKMSAPDQQFLVDFKSYFHSGNPNRSDSGDLIFRTSTDNDIGRRAVEGIIDAREDFTDETRMIRIAISSFLREMARNGENPNIAGVEFVEDPKKATRSFRMLFGQPNMNGGGHIIDYNANIFPMINFNLSGVGVVKPTATMGLWRLICRNTAMDDVFPMAQWAGSGNSENFENEMNDLAQIGVPYCRHLQEQLEPSFNRKLERSYVETLNELTNNRSISESHATIAKHYIEQEADNDINQSKDRSEWAFFNLLTNCAKQLNPIGRRESAERNALTCILAGGFDTVLSERLTKKAIGRKVVENMKNHPIIGQIMANRGQQKAEAAMVEQAQNN